MDTEKIAPTDAQRDVLLGVLSLLFFLFLCWFFAVVIGSSAGEAAAALGGVVGGAIGAGGAGFSVYYSIVQQRKDEAEKSSYAILTEIAVLTKYIIGHLGFCQMIKSGDLQFPREQLHTVLHMPEYIIYKAVADKVAFFPRPTQVVEFYTRLGEMSGIASLIIHSPSKNNFIEPDEIDGLADLIITECQVVAAILSYLSPNPSSEKVLSEGLRSQVLDALHQQLEQARTLFPRSVAFN